LACISHHPIFETRADFKKLPEDEKVNAFKGLLKGKLTCMTLEFTPAFYSIVAYQTEIDSLTKRSKTTDNAFLHIYKLLAEAPDPYPLLDAAVVRALCTQYHSDLPNVVLIGPGS
jgi:homeobox protein cut-like